MGSVAYCLSMRHFSDRLWEGIPSLLFYYLHEPYSLIPFILVPILGLLLTLLSLVFTSTRKTCCSRLNCCSTCFTLPRVEHAALVVSLPHSRFVLDANGKPKLFDEDVEVKGEEIEMVDNDEAVEKIDQPGKEDNHEHESLISNK